MTYTYAVWTMVLEKTLESPLDCKEIKPVHPKKKNQSWIFTGRNDAEAEAPIICPPDGKNWLIGKDPDIRKDSRQEEKGKTGWDGRMASPSRWTWAWVRFGSWWWIEKTGILQSMALQTDGHDWKDWSEVNKLRTKRMLLLLLLSRFSLVRLCATP